MRIYTIIIVLSLFSMSESKIWAQQGASATASRVSVKGTTVSSAASKENYIAANDNGGTDNSGLHKPFNISVKTGVETKGIDLSYPVGPNLSTDFVTLTVQHGQYKNMSMRLFTIKGQVILDQKLAFGQSTILLPDYSNPLYMLRVYNNDQEVKAFKVIKNK